MGTGGDTGVKEGADGDTVTGADAVRAGGGADGGASGGVRGVSGGDDGGSGGVRGVTGDEQSKSGSNSLSVGYIRVAFFGERSAQDVRGAIESLQSLSDNAPHSWIVDLRANPGGIVLNGVEVAELFLANGDVLCQVKYPDGQSEVVRLTEAVSLVPPSQPIVVLANRGTASVSEILAGALRDDRGAVIVGETTFGKGRTQRIVRLQDDSLLFLSNAVYLTPKGDPVDRVGLRPDVVCQPQVTERVVWVAGETTAESLRSDPCIAKAKEILASKTGSRGA